MNQNRIMQGTVKYHVVNCPDFYQRKFVTIEPKAGGLLENRNYVEWVETAPLSPHNIRCTCAQLIQRSAHDDEPYLSAEGVSRRYKAHDIRRVYGYGTKYRHFLPFYKKVKVDAKTGYRVSYCPDKAGKEFVINRGMQTSPEPIPPVKAKEPVKKAVVDLKPKKEIVNPNMKPPTTSASLTLGQKKTARRRRAVQRLQSQIASLSLAPSAPKSTLRGSTRFKPSQCWIDKFVPTQRVKMIRDNGHIGDHSIVPVTTLKSILTTG